MNNINIDTASKWLQYIYDLALDKAETMKKETVVLTATTTAVVAYLCAVRYYRYKNLNLIRAKYPNPDDILNDSEAALYIYNIALRKEFPYLARISLELAFFKTFIVPTISKILNGTGEFNDKNVARRAEDTDLVVNEVVESYGRIQKQLKANPNTPQADIDAQYKRPVDSINRLNELHGKYPILNNDFLYTLTLFVFEPISWINRFEWRQLDKREENALFKVWYDIGKSMNMKDIPETFEELKKFKEEYGASHIEYHPANWKVGKSTFRLLLTQLPASLREPIYPYTLHVLPSLLDSYDTAAFRLPVKENSLITTLVHAGLRSRALFTRYFLLPRSTFHTRTPFYANNEGKYVPNFFMYQPRPYSEGYKIEEFGPTKFLKKKGKHPAVVVSEDLSDIMPGKCPMMHH